jgi:hypothetical protein
LIIKNIHRYQPSKFSTTAQVVGFEERKAHHVVACFAEQTYSKSAFLNPKMTTRPPRRVTKWARSRHFFLKQKKTRMPKNY